MLLKIWMQMAFVDAVLETTPINYLHQYLVAKGKVSKKDRDLKVRQWIDFCCIPCVPDGC